MNRRLDQCLEIQKHRVERLFAFNLSGGININAQFLDCVRGHVPLPLTCSKLRTVVGVIPSTLLNNWWVRVSVCVGGPSAENKG